MIEIKIGQQSIQLSPTAAIKVRLENPILGGPDKVSPGSFSYPFDIPAGDTNPKNAAIIKNPDVAENNESYSYQNAELFYGGIPFKKGKLKFTSSSKDKASGYFTFGLNSISEAFKTAKLKDVLDDEFVIGNSAIVKTVFVKRLDSSDFNLSVNGTTYTFANTSLGINTNESSGDCLAKTLDKPFEWWPVIELASGSSPLGMSGTYAKISLKQYYTFAPGDIRSRYCGDPLLEMSVAVGEGDSPALYETESFLDNYYTQFTAFVAPYQYLVDDEYPDNIIRFPLLFNADMHEAVTKETEAVNLMSGLGIIRNDPNYGEFVVKNYNSLQPFLLVKYVLDKIADAFGFTWSGDFYNHAELANLLLWNTAPLDVPQKYIGPDKFIFWKRSFKTSDLVDDITVVELLKRIQSRYNLAVYYNEATKTVGLSSRESMARATQYSDITPMCSPIMSYETQRTDGYVLRVAADETDAFSLAEQVSVGTGATPVDMTCGRLFRERNTIWETEVVTGLYVSQRAGSKGMTRIFHYSGIEDVGTFKYPTAIVSGPGMPESMEDLHDQFHKIWLYFEKNRLLINVEVAYPLRDLLRYDFALKRRFNRVNYMVKSIELTIANSGVKVSNLELITMK